MRYFTLLDFQVVVLLVFLGLAVLFLITVAFSLYELGQKKQRKPKKRENYPEGIQVSGNGIPPLLIFIYGGFIVWALAYMVVIGLRGIAF
ncbi:MAG: hypothetical protein GTN81_10375 [Proteobacteria bacterium]|nr:hypothetical protein [Pseudomonadota bacterium]